MLTINYKWFEENYEELKRKYNNKYLIIQNKKVLNDTNTFEDAVKLCGTLKLGTFIIQEVPQKVQCFNSRVRFN